ncbi:hypothetical protein BHM03_00007831 [Ensete ventricosum]|nr:hypothetical protein BHM03_00007831 [Ensete ventricosum]
MKARTQKDEEEEEEEEAVEVDLGEGSPPPCLPRTLLLETFRFDALSLSWAISVGACWGEGFYGRIDDAGIRSDDSTICERYVAFQVAQPVQGFSRHSYGVATWPSQWDSG